MIIGALIVGLSSHVQAHFDKLFEVSLPTKGPIQIAQLEPESNNVAFTTPALSGKSNLYLLQYRERRILSLGLINYVFDDQVDCKNGILGIGRLATGKDRIFFHRMSDGAKVGEMAWNEKKRRIGNVVQDVDRIVDLNGNLIIRNPTPDFGKPLSKYLGTLIWNGKRRLSIVGRGDVPSDIKDVVELDIQWKKGKRTWLSNYAMAYDHIVGNPDTGAFAVFERNSRDNRFSAIYTKNMKRIPGDLLNASSISPNGIVCNPDHLGNYDQYSTGETLCFDANTGAIRWRGKKGGSWFGDYLVTNFSESHPSEFWPGSPILSGKTGKPVGKMPMSPKGLLVSGSGGDFCYSVSKANALVVYRVTIK